MSSNIDHLLVETATRVATTTDENGDTKYAGTTSVACLFRDVTSLTNTGNRREVNVEGILWLPASEAQYAQKGAIYYHPDEGYLKIDSRIRAKTLVTDNTVQFIKCGVNHHRQVS